MTRVSDASTTVDLKKMGRVELEAFLKAVQNELIEREKAEKQAKVQQVLELMNELGITLDDITQAGKKKKKQGNDNKKRPSQPIYRNPENPEKTWTGKGRRPAWMPQDKDKWPEYEIKK